MILCSEIVYQTSIFYNPQPYQKLNNNEIYLISKIIEKAIDSAFTKYAFLLKKPFLKKGLLIKFNERRN